MSAPAAIASRSVGKTLSKRAERSTTPPSTIAPYLAEAAPIEKVAMRCVVMRFPCWSRLRLSWACCSLAGIHSTRFDHGGSGRRAEKADEGFRGFRLLAVRRDGGRENKFLLQFGRECSCKLDAGSDQHVDEKDPKLGLAAGDKLGNLGCLLLRLGLGFHRFGQIKPLEDFQHVSARGALPQECNGFGIKQRLFQRV